MIEIEFCRSKCCPIVQKTDDGDIVIYEQSPSNFYHGEITMNIDSFRDMVSAAKEGKFDSLL